MDSEANLQPSPGSAGPSASPGNPSLPRTIGGSQAKGKCVGKTLTHTRPSNLLDGPLPAATTRPHQCECGRSFGRPSSLALHKKECGNPRDRGKCQHCSATFDIFAGVRQHERRRHPEKYHQELTDRLPAPESSILDKLARIEVRTLRKDFYTEMMAATQLTKHQIRHRREKEIYKKYLDRARRELQEETGNPFSRASNSSTAPKPPTRDPPPTPRAVRAIRRAASVERQMAEELADPATFSAAPTPVVNRAPTDTVPDAPRRVLRPVVFLTRIDEMASPFTPADMSPKTPRERAQVCNTPPLSQEARRLSRRLSFSLNDLAEPDQPTPDESVYKKEFHDFLERVGHEPENYSPPAIELATAGLTYSSEALQPFIDDFVRKITCARPPKSRGNRAPNTRAAYGHGGKGLKAAEYKKAQDLFTKARKSLAQNILAGKPMSSVSAHPSLESTEDLYAGILESESPEDNESCTGAETLDLDNPVSYEEVATAKNNWHPSAPGPDGVRVEDLKKASNHDLSVFFTVVLLRNQLPQDWTTSRTTLIPKDGDLRDPSNWRPITISSVAQRLFHRVLSNRIKDSVSLHQNQRGFVALDGTLANSTVLTHYIKTRRENTRPYCVVSLDVRKAFDTVSHHSIRRAMRRCGIPELLTAYVLNSLSSSTTTIKVDQASTRPIRICRGVKQGDPLSPLLFNLVIDELLSELNSPGKGGTLGPNQHCSAMAFADDVVLLEDDELNLPETLQQVEDFFRKRGMAINPKKSKCLAATVVQKKVVPRSKPAFRIGGQWIPMVPLCDTFRFLGHEFNASGVLKPCLSNLPVWLNNIHRAPLKPDQKLVILRDYTIPRLLYGLQNPRITAKTLRDADRLIKAFVKRTLHLHIHTSDACIHASIRDGGLGIMELRKAIPRIFIGRLASLLEKTDDAQLSFVLQSPWVYELMGRLSGLAGDVPESQLWRERISTGDYTHGVELANEDSASRTWVAQKPNGWTGRDYVRAVQLRTANLPSKGIPSNPVEERRCRAGCGASETTCHILQKCDVTKNPRLKRHNEIVNKIARHCRKKGWAVEQEPHVRHPNGKLFVPDLVIHQPDNRTIVVDVQVSWEGSTPMDVIWELKKRVYDNVLFREAAARRWVGKILHFHPVILGARGIWPRANSTTVDVLQIPPWLRCSCVHSTLKWGSTIHALFMRSVWE